MAEALYNLCKFEYFLMGYQRATRLSPDNETALMGIVKCRKTITGSLRHDIFDMTDIVERTWCSSSLAYRTAERGIPKENVLHAILLLIHQLLLRFASQLPMTT